MNFSELLYIIALLITNHAKVCVHRVEVKEFFLHYAPVPLQLQHSVLNTWNITSYRLLDNHRNDTILYTID